MRLIDKNLLKDGTCKIVVKKGSNKRIIEGIYNSKLNTVFFIFVCFEHFLTFGMIFFMIFFKIFH